MEPARYAIFCAKMLSKTSRGTGRRLLAAVTSAASAPPACSASCYSDVGISLSRRPWSSLPKRTQVRQRLVEQRAVLRGAIASAVGAMPSSDTVTKQNVVSIDDIFDAGGEERGDRRHVTRRQAAPRHGASHAAVEVRLREGINGALVVRDAARRDLPSDDVREERTALIVAAKVTHDQQPVAQHPHNVVGVPRFGVDRHAAAGPSSRLHELLRRQPIAGALPALRPEYEDFVARIAPELHLVGHCDDVQRPRTIRSNDRGAVRCAHTVVEQPHARGKAFADQLVLRCDAFDLHGAVASERPWRGDGG